MSGDWPGMPLTSFASFLLFELASLALASTLREHCDRIVTVYSTACDWLVIFPLYCGHGGEEVLLSMFAYK
jgi:hypothetical protein